MKSTLTPAFSTCKSVGLYAQDPLRYARADADSLLLRVGGTL
jgi:hypothetical protein